MSKSSREQQVEDERKILAELQKNCNESIDTVAKHCGFSRQKAWRIIKQLEKSHMIWGYTAIVDEEKQGLQKFMLSIKRSNKTLDKTSMAEIAYDRLDKTISNLGVTIESSYFIHGEYDWILIFISENLQDAKKFTDIILGAYPGIVERVNLSQILFIQRDHKIANPDQQKLKEFL
jgi:DNA-binding Lrp family transcriptional regulator